MKPLVSIVVPSYNQAHYLTMSLDSVFFQNYPNLEIIICNHGSTDNTSEVIADYLKGLESEQVDFLERLDEDGKTLQRKTELRFPQGRQVKVYESTENLGGTASYNVGFRNATGKYCMYLVGDDYFAPDALARMVDVMEKTGVDVVYTDMFVVNDAGNILQRLSKPAYSFEACFCEWFHLGVNRLYKRELHERYGYYDESIRNANDYDMFLRFAMEGATFRHIPEVLYYTRKHSNHAGVEPASWANGGYSNLMLESIECAKRARTHLERMNKGGA